MTETISPTAVEVIAAAPESPSELRQDLVSLFRLFAAMGVIGAVASVASYVLFRERFVAWASRKVHDFYLSPTTWRSLGLSLSVMATVAVLEVIVMGWRDSGVRRLFVRPSRSARFDLLFGILMMSKVMPFFQVLFTFGSVLIASRAVSALLAPLGDARLVIAPTSAIGIALAAAGLWMCSTFNDYWWHRFMHTSLVWPLHRVHHSAKELNIITQFRGHPGDAVVQTLIAIFPLTFLNPSEDVLVIFSTLAAFNGALTHSQLPWSYGWVGRWILCSPRYHQIHHSTNRDHYNSNFSFLLLWDHVFGTWYDGDAAPTAYGVSDNIYGDQSMVSRLWFDLRDFYGNFPRRFRKLIR